MANIPPPSPSITNDIYFPLPPPSPIDIRECYPSLDNIVMPPPPPMMSAPPPVVITIEERGRSRSRSRSSSRRTYSYSPIRIHPRRRRYRSPSRSRSRSRSPSPLRTRRRSYRPRSRTPSPVRYIPPPPPPVPTIVRPLTPPSIPWSDCRCAPPPQLPITCGAMFPSPPAPLPLVLPPLDPVDILTFHYNKNMAYAPAAKTYDEAIDVVLELWPELHEFGRDRISLLVGGSDQLVRVPKIAWQVVLCDLPRYEVMHIQVDQLPPPPQYQVNGKGKGKWGSENVKGCRSGGFFSSIKKILKKICRR